jgi:Protein of unknown function (DUF3800)
LLEQKGKVYPAERLAEWTASEGSIRIVDELADIILSRDDPDKYMLFLRAYFDETGDEPDPNSQICGFGGAVLRSQEWGEIEDRWKAALIEFEVPYFHSSDFFTYHDIWDDPKWRDDIDHCHAFYGRLWKIIHKFKPIPIVCLLPLEPYRKLTDQLRKEFVGAYFLTYQTIMASALELFGTPSGLKVTRFGIILDNKKGFQSAVNAFYDYLVLPRKIMADRVQRPIFENWRSVVQLQVADIIAYESHREYRRRLYTPEKPKRWGFEQLEKLDRLVGGNPHPLGDERSRVIFRPQEFIDSLAMPIDQKDIYADLQSALEGGIYG